MRVAPQRVRPTRSSICRASKTALRPAARSCGSLPGSSQVGDGVNAAAEEAERRGVAGCPSSQRSRTATRRYVFARAPILANLFGNAPEKFLSALNRRRLPSHRQGLAELRCGGQVPEPGKRLAFELPDPLTGEADLPADRLQRLWVVV
jgi:hypothetical protein